MKNKGQISLGDAPNTVLIVGLVFLLMATIAYIGFQYGDAIRIPNTAGSAVNESIAKPTTAGITLATGSLNDISCGTITTIWNGTSGVAIALANITQSGCVVTNTTSASQFGATWLVSYPYTYSANSVATNITDSMNTQINNNTAIAGIVLTIALVGIVLSILIGVFVLVGRRRV